MKQGVSAAESGQLRKCYSGTGPQFAISLWNFVFVFLVILFVLTSWDYTTETAYTTPYGDTLGIRSTTPYFTWYSQCVECPNDVFNLGDQSLALDSHGRPHVVYLGDYVYYAWYDGLSWQREIVAEGSGIIYDFYQSPASIALDQNNDPHITFLDISNNSILYAYRAADGWQKSVVDTADPGEWIAYETSIALDSHGSPHISYSDYGNLKYAYRLGEAWYTRTVDWGWAEHYISLALDDENLPHISYFSVSRGQSSIKYAHWTAFKWEIETIETAIWVGEFNSLALDKLGNPHISYLDVTNSEINYAIKKNGTWEIQRVDESSWWGGFTSIQIDNADRPHIAYQSNNEIRYARLLDVASPE